MSETKIHIASVAYTLPESTESVDSLLMQEKIRVDRCLQKYTEEQRKSVIADLGIKKVRVCAGIQPYGLARDVFFKTMDETGLKPQDIDLVIDFSTFPNLENQFFSVGHQLCKEFEIDNCINIAYKVGGCAGLPLAFKTAAALMKDDPAIKNTLLVSADSPPAGNRTLLPITVQGDAGTAVILQSVDKRPELIVSEICTHGFLHDVISLEIANRENRHMLIKIDTEKLENELKPIYYLNFYRLIQKVLDSSGLSIESIDHVIYSNLSSADQQGFIKALGFPEGKVFTQNLAEFGHTFAGDLIINYADLCRLGKVKPDQTILFASAGIGFTWGVSLVKT